jgi:hypothetical protein
VLNFVLVAATTTLDFVLGLDPGLTLHGVRQVAERLRIR